VLSVMVSISYTCADAAMARKRTSMENIICFIL